MLRFLSGGGSHKAVHRYDLSQTSAGVTRIIDAITASDTYPASTIDPGRGGFWHISRTGQPPLLFINGTTYAVTSYNVGMNINKDGHLIYVPAPWDCLVFMGEAPGPSQALYVSKFSGNTPGSFADRSGAMSGSLPSDKRAGGVWSTLLNCIVVYNAAGSNVVHKLTPPSPGNETTGTWTWTTETLTGVSGAVPCRNTVADNGAWSRFVEVPNAKCFIWCDSITGPVQAWRLTGMV